MALVLSNRVQETTTTTGTGAITLAGAVAGFQSFAAIGDGNTTYYTVTSGTAWEVGIGTYTAAGTTLARTTILSSSAGGAAITLAGTSTVFVTYPAEQTIANGYGTLPVANGGTNSTATATAGGVAYGTGTAIAVNAAGPAGYVLTSGGAAPPVWTPVASLAVGTDAYWGSFWDTTTQTAPAPNTAYMLTLNSADPTNNGVTVVSGSRVTFTHAGVYSLTFSIQFENTDNANAAHDVNVWLRKNDSGSTGDVPDSDSKFTVPPKHAGVKGSLIGTVNFVLTLAAGDFIELVYAVSDVTVTVASTPPGTSPVSPRIPSIIFTAVAAAPVGLGYGGVESFTSLTVGTGSKTFTVNTNATDTAFIVGNRVRLVNSSVNYMDGVITAYSGTSMTVLVDGTAGSGTYTAWFVTLTGSVGGVTSFSGNSTGLTPATATTGAIALGGTLNVANGGTGATTLSSGFHLKGNDTSAVSASIIYETGTFAGFNTTTPQATIDFGSTVGQAILLYRGGTDKYGAEVRAVDGGATGTNIFAGYSGPIRFRTSGATFVPVTRMIVTSTGDVGIGTNAPSAKLDLGAAVDGVKLLVYGSGNTKYGFGIATSMLRYFVPSGSAVHSFGGISTADGTTYTESMRLNASGNLGLGTSFPVGRLMVAAADTSNTIGSATASINITNTDANAFGRTSNLNFTVDDGNLSTRRLATISAVYTGFGGGGTEGALAFATQFNGSLSERMRISSAGLVGLGTSAPSARLTVIPTANITSSTGTLQTAIGEDSNNSIYQMRMGYVAEGGYYKGVINTLAGGAGTFLLLNPSGGNVGIGTSAPIAPLDISANLGTFSATGNSILRLNNVNSNGQSPLDFFINGTLRGRFRSDFVGNMNYVVNGGSHTFLVGGDSGVGTVRMTLDATTLDINANAKVPSGSSFYWGDATSQITAVNAGAMRFLTGNASEKMRIEGNGNVGIGTTAPTSRLQVDAASGINAVSSFINTSAGSTLACIAASINSGGNNTGSYHFAGVTQSVAIWYLYGNGTTSYTSDIRVKKNVTTTRDGYLEDVCKLRVVKYNWYNDSDDTPRELGFIAQEVEQVFPGLVQDALHPTKDGEIHKVLKGSVMMPIMLKALQEASAQIEALTARVAQLEGK